MERAAAMNHRKFDDDTIDACRRGDRDAMRQLFETYKDRVYAIALNFTGNEAAAKDVTQQVFLKLLTSLDQFRSDAAFSTWLYRLVVDACIDEHRRNRRYADIAPAADHVDSGTRGDDDVYAGEVAAIVRVAVGSLRPKLRIAVLLRYFEGLTYEEMAEALGCSMGTVASRLNRGHKQLARKLAHLRDEGFKGGDVS